jgi:membrane dipeptidase
MIAQTGGVIGVFLANKFVVGKDRVGTIADVVAHISYIRDLIGIEHVAIGTDLGGIVSGGIEGLTHVDQLSNLESALLAADYTEQEIEKVFYQNASRVLQSHLSEKMQ